MRLVLAAAALAAVLSACAHEHRLPIDDPKDDTPLHGRVALRCEVPLPPDGPPGPLPAGATEGRRIKGARNVQLSQATLVRLHDRGYNRVSVRAEVCLDTTGSVSCIDLGSGTRPRDIAQTVIDAVQEWKYEPYRLKDEPTTACFAVNFNYRIQ